MVTNKWVGVHNLAFFDLFSRRNGIVKQSDIYQYEDIPQTFRNQFVLIVDEIITSNHRRYDVFWKFVHTQVKIELGVLRLGEGYEEKTQVLNYLLNSNNLQALDIIDLLVFYFHSLSIKWDSDLSAYCDRAFDRINQKLKQNSLGYEIVENQLIRIDNQYIHSEVVKKAIGLLQEQEFHSVSDEFLKAHEHYKDRDYKDAIVNAGKAFESVMKKICSEKRYTFNAQKDTASALINILLKNEFIPSFMQNQFVGLKNTLENSVPTLRNKFGGHGQGEEIIQVPESIVRYTLNLCATNIVFLVERYKETK